MPPRLGAWLRVAAMVAGAVVLASLQVVRRQLDPLLGAAMVAIFTAVAVLVAWRAVG